MRIVCKNWIRGDSSKFHIGVSDNAAKVTLALNSDMILEAPLELHAQAMAEPEGSDEYDDDDDNHFPPLAPMHEGSAGCFAHLLNLIVEVYTLYQIYHLIIIQKTRID